jgi:hypothetical protein
MKPGTYRLIPALAAIVCAALVAACGDKPEVEKPGAAARKAERTVAIPVPVPATESAPEACTLLTEDDVRHATGWENPVLQNESDDEDADSGCIFVDGADPQNLENYISILVYVVTETYPDSNAFAQSVGNGDGDYLEPATPIDDFSMPAIETRTDVRFSLRGITRRGIDLEVTSGAPKVSRDLFIAALARL